jgi:hypothetical protein
MNCDAFDQVPFYTSEQDKRDAIEEAVQRGEWVPVMVLSLSVSVLAPYLRLRLSRCGVTVQFVGFARFACCCACVL